MGRVVLLETALGAGALLVFNGLGVWWIRSYLNRIERKMDALSESRSECRESLPRTYATRRDVDRGLDRVALNVGRAWGQIDDLDKRVSRMEGKLNGNPVH